jgi:predicted PurR-regulated permease PerM
MILGILLAAAIEPLVHRLRRRGFPRGRAILVIYAGILATFGLTSYLIVPTLYSQGREFIAGIPALLEQFDEQARTSSIAIVRERGPVLIRNAQNAYDNPAEALRVFRLDASQVTQALTVVTSVVGVLFTTVSVMIVSFYWMTEKALIKRLVLGLFPLDKRDRAHTLWDEIEHRLGGWARGQLILMLVIGMISTIAYSPLLLDVGEFWFLLGIWAGLTEAIPFVGPFLGGGLAVIVALTDSWQKALLVAGFVVLLQQVEGNVLVPRVMKNAVGLTPLAVILAILIGGALLGVLGAVLAIPVAAAVQVVLGDLLRSREETVDTAALGSTMAATLSGRPGATPSGGIAHPAGEAAMTFTGERPGGLTTPRASGRSSIDPTRPS